MPRRLLMLAVAVATVAVVGGSPLATARADAAGPTTGPVFNDPTGLPYEQVAIIRRLMLLIDGAEPGSIIRMAQYTFSMEEVADKLIAAHARGVRVRLILDDHEVKPVWQRMVDVFGSDPTQESYAVICHMSCFTDNFPSYMHSKIYMFSTTGGKSHVVMISSANPTYSQARHGWNDGYVVVGNKTVYNGFKKNFEDMTAGAMEPVQGTESPDYYFTAEAGTHKAYFFPISGVGRETDPMWGILNNIRCTGVASGYGYQGRTLVKVAMFQWSDRRVRLADKLWQLDDLGCSVEILYNPFEIDPEVLASLRKPGGRNGNPTMRSAYVDEDRDGIADAYVHNKYVLVNGVYAGDTSSKIVFTGSPNWVNNALRYSNEVMLKIISSSTYSAYFSHFVKLRTWAIEHSTHRAGSGGPTIVPAGRPPRSNEFLGPWAG